MTVLRNKEKAFDIDFRHKNTLEMIKKLGQDFVLPGMKVLILNYLEDPLAIKDF